MIEQAQSLVREMSDEDYQAFEQWLLLVERKARPRREAEEKTQEAVAAGQAEVVRELRESGVVQAPPVPEVAADPEAYPAWVDPGTDHARMYLLGDRVRHEGRVWCSEHPGLNHWEPGSTGVDARVWRDITDELTQAPEETPALEVGDAPAPEQESGEDAAPDPEGEPTEIPAWQPGMQLTAGDLVTHDGRTWRVKMAHTSHAGWVPGPATHAVFE